jgi:hypothetical protein
MALNDDQIQKIRVTLATLGWTDVMHPTLANRGRQAVKALCLSRSERTTAYKGTDFDTDDEVLRAMIRDCEWMIAVWSNEIAAAEHNRRLDELDRQASQQDATRANP